MRLGLTFGAAICLLAAPTCWTILSEPPPMPVQTAAGAAYRPSANWLHHRIILSRTQTEPGGQGNLTEWTLSR